MLLEFAVKYEKTNASNFPVDSYGAINVSNQAVTSEGGTRACPWKGKNIKRSTINIFGNG
jgi:hypothetical protein